MPPVSAIHGEKVFTAPAAGGSEGPWFGDGSCGFISMSVNLNDIVIVWAGLATSGPTFVLTGGFTTVTHVFSGNGVIVVVQCLASGTLGITQEVGVGAFTGLLAHRLRAGAEPIWNISFCG